MSAKDVKVTVNLPQTIVETLRELARNDGTTMTEILRKSILTEKLLTEERDRGSKILIEDKNNQFRQLIWR